MTVGIGVKCTDGVILACDSLTTFGRGVPVLRYSNKVDLLEHESLESPIAVVAAGITAFYDKFRDRALRNAIAVAAGHLDHKLDVVDFCEGVCEPIVAALLKEYAIDRNKFFGAPVFEFSFSLIIGGATRDGELRCYIVHPEGLTERIDHYGTIGSGAAYAELFLRYLVGENLCESNRAGQAALYTIKGVELMDPHVGGRTSIKVLSVKEGKLLAEDFRGRIQPETARQQMDEVLRKIGQSIGEIVAGGADSA